MAVDTVGPAFSPSLYTDDTKPAPSVQSQPQQAPEQAPKPVESSGELQQDPSEQNPADDGGKEARGGNVDIEA